MRMSKEVLNLGKDFADVVVEANLDLGFQQTEIVESRNDQVHEPNRNDPYELSQHTCWMRMMFP